MTSTCSTVVNFTALEFLHRLSRVALEEDIRLELSPNFEFAKTRRTGKKRASAVNLDSLQFPSESEILNIIDKAKTEAEKIASDLGMHLTVPSVFLSVPEVDEADDDVDTEVIRMNDTQVVDNSSLQDNPAAG